VITALCIARVHHYPLARIRGEYARAHLDHESRDRKELGRQGTCHADAARPFSMGCSGIPGARVEQMSPTVKSEESRTPTNLEPRFLRQGTNTCRVKSVAPHRAPETAHLVLQNTSFFEGMLNVFFTENKKKCTRN
jgi:hypothetical protein